MPQDETSQPKPPRAAERILATAAELFYRQGFRAVGVDEIVTRAGATKPTLYRAFPSKDHLIAAYLKAESDAFWTAADAVVAARPGDPRAQLLALVESVVETSSRTGGRGCALTNATVEYPADDHLGRQVAVAHKQRLRDRLRDITKAMDARKPKKLADSLLLLIEGAQITRQMFGKDGPAGAMRGAAEALIDAHTRAESDAAE